MSKALYKRLIRETQNKIDTLWDEFAQRIINNEASVFVGTGLSMNSGVPSWERLLDLCYQHLDINPSRNTDLYKIAQYYANQYSDAELRKKVHAQINTYYESNVYLSTLLDLNFKSIWTTNYDNLIETELRNKKIPCNVVGNEQNLAQINTYDKVNVYKINGDISYPNEMVLTQNDYDNYEFTHSLFLIFLKKELVSNSFLFIGYSFNDQIILNCLSSTVHLLAGNGNRHYALIYIDDKVTNEIEYKAQDLKQRYNIECIYVSDETLLATLNLLNAKVKKDKVFISGAYYDVDADTDLFADNLSRTLVTTLLKDGKRISTGIGRRLGTYITGYANQYLAEHSIINPQKYLSMRPFPFHIELTNEQKSAYRNYMQHDCQYAIFMFGQSEHTVYSGGYNVHKHYSYGVYQEFTIAKKRGLKIIPIGSTGYEAEVIWQEIKDNINQYYYLSKKIDKLKTERDPEKISKLVMSILD